MYMIEITEDKLHTMAELAEKGIKHLGKLMQYIEDIEDSFSGAYGEKGRLGMREDFDDYRYNRRRR